MPNPMKAKRPNKAKHPASKSMKVGATILEQLGGSRFILMVGAKDLVALDNGLQFGLKGALAKDKINKVRIVLNRRDLYDVEFFNIRGTHIKTVKEVNNVDVGNLRRTFRMNTGLDTSL